jgi:hypothetical protein
MAGVGERLRAVLRGAADCRQAVETWLFGYDFFLSHTRDGKPYAAALQRELTAAGQRCFLDQTELDAGSGLRRRVAGALDRSAVLVLVISDHARAAPWVLGEARFYKERRPNDPIVPVAFADSAALVPWVAINRDLFDSDVEHIALESTPNGRFMAVRVALWDRFRSAPSAAVKAAAEDYLGLCDAPANLAAATPAPEVVSKVVHSRRRLAVATRARRGGIAVLALAAMLATSVALFVVRYYRHLPAERLDAARVALKGMKFQVNDDDLAHFVVSWDATGEQGPLPLATWRGAAGPLKVLDRYSDIAEISLFFTDVPDLEPLAGVTSPRSVKVLGSRADSLGPVAGMNRLETLYASNFLNLTDDDLDAVAGCTSLTTLHLIGCPRLTGAGLARLRGLRLRELFLTDCKRVDNAALEALAGMPLETLILNRTGVRVDGALVDRILSIPTLKSVGLSGLAGEPDAIARLAAAASARGLKANLPKSSPRPGASPPAHPPLGGPSP